MVVVKVVVGLVVVVMRVEMSECTVCEDIHKAMQNEVDANPSCCPFLGCLQQGQCV